MIKVKRLAAGTIAALLLSASILGNGYQTFAAEQGSDTQNIQSIAVVGEVTEAQGTARLIQEGVYPEESTTVDFYNNQNWENAKEALLAGLKNVDAEIDLYEYSIDKTQVQKLYEETVNENPELFYVGSSYSYSWDSANHIVIIKPYYAASKSEIIVMRAEFEEAVQELVSNVDCSLSVPEIALQVHDYIIAHTDYDYTNYEAQTVPTISHTAYGALVKHVSVCDGYALAYNYILNKCFNIECYVVSSDAMAHAWNQIKADGNYYHVDLTYDDPTRDSNKEDAYSVYHDFFMCSDSNIQDESIHGTGKHYGWTANGLTCDDEKYDHADFRMEYNQNDMHYGALQPMSYADGKWYYVNYEDFKIYGYDFKSNTSTAVDLKYTFVGSVAADNNKLYYASYEGEKIYSCDFDGTSIALEYSAATQINKLYFENQKLRYCNGKNIYDTGIKKNSNVISLEEISIEPTEVELEVGENVDLAVTLKPENTTEGFYISWLSSDEDVAVVEQGVITAVSAGTATVTATVGEKTATCVVTVNKPLENITVYNGVDYSAVYNAQYYVNKYTDLKNAFGRDGEALLAHFVNYGMREGRQASESFNVYSYRAFNADLQVAFDTDLSAYYTHYMMYGQQEGRQATGEYTYKSYKGTDYAAVYDEAYYTTMYTDLQGVFGNDTYLYIKHFVEYGMREGRQASENFNPVIYKQAYGDLQSAFGDDFKAYYMHYMNCGAAEGRSGSATVYNGVDYKAVYHYSYYKNTYADLKAAFGDDEYSYLKHFANYGMQEGRQASEDFNVQYYKNTNADLRNAFGSDLGAYYMHYIQYGLSEGRIGQGDSYVLKAGSFGIDVSEKQGNIDWEAVKESGVEYAIIRVGIGNDEINQDDAYAAENIAECEILGIPYGVYLFSYAVSEEEAASEAQHILRMLNGHNPQLGVYLDMESTDYYSKYGEFDVFSTEGRRRITDYAKIVLDALENKGYHAGIYSNLEYYNKVFYMDELEGYRWVAAWNEQAEAEVEAFSAFIWQFTSEASVDGVDGFVDQDKLLKDIIIYG